MTVSPIFSKKVLTTAPRMPLRLACIIHFPGGEIASFSTNISYKGLGVELPPDADGLDPRLIHAVTIEGIGRLETNFRWRRWGLAGLAFRNRSGARPLLNAYFRQIGTFPV